MINKLYNLTEIDVTEWHRVNMPDRIAYVTDDSIGRNGCGCYLVKLDDNLYSGFVCDKHHKAIVTPK